MSQAPLGVYVLSHGHLYRSTHWLLSWPCSLLERRMQAMFLFPRHGASPASGLEHTSCVRFLRTNTEGARSTTIAYTDAEASYRWVFLLKNLLTYQADSVIIITVFYSLIFTAISVCLVVKGLWLGGFQLSGDIDTTGKLWSYVQNPCGRILSGIRERIRPFFSSLWLEILDRGILLVLFHVCSFWCGQWTVSVALRCQWSRKTRQGRELMCML